MERSPAYFGVVRLLDAEFGHTMNEPSYKVLNNVRIMHGGSITHELADDIPARLEELGYASENVVLGLVMIVPLVEPTVAARLAAPS